MRKFRTSSRSQWTVSLQYHCGESLIKDHAGTGTTQFLGARNGTKTGRNPKTHEMGKDANPGRR
jgi:hypothetical protein